MDGICTLANDRVYDQLIALLNSIEAIAGKNIPVCVYPYDDHTEKIAAAIAQRPHVQLYDDRDSIERWDNFAKEAWDTHPTAKEAWSKAGSSGYHRFGTHRRFCAFDAPFDRFVYMDADTLLMGDLQPIFDRLQQHDCVVYDFQYKDPTHVYQVNSPKLTEVFSPTRIETEIFCSGFYASHRNIFDREKIDFLIAQLRATQAEILYPFAPDQTLINYMFMRSELSICNLAIELPRSERTGCCVTSDHFQTKNNLLYDKNKRLTYIHYIGLSSSLFTQLCAGENIDFPYRDLFLYYRYLSEPEKKPQFTTKFKQYENRDQNFMARLKRKLKLTK